MVTFRRIRDDAFGNRVWIQEWANLAETDTDPEPARVPHFSDVTVQIYGPAFGGGTIIVEGALFTYGETQPPTSVVPVYAPLTDIFGNPISFTAAGIATRLQNTYLIRPRVTAGAAVDVTVRMMFTGMEAGF